MAFDRWFRYPAGFASDYAAHLLSSLNLPRGSMILDPFAGSGVIGTGCQDMGLRFFGVEAHPVVAELADLKLRPAPEDPEHLLNAAQGVVTSAQFIAKPTKAAIRKLRITETELVLRSFADQILLQLTTLRELIKSHPSKEWQPYLKWALLATLRDVASVKVGWPYQRPGTARKPKHKDVFARFISRIEWMKADLSHRRFNEGEQHSRVVAGDSRDPQIWQACNELGHGCISSPPYLNNFDYADATRLELYFWGYASSWAEMCSTVRADMVTATTQQSSVPAASRAQEELLQYSSFSERIVPLIEQLKHERSLRSRGKEYDQVLPDYFAAMARVLKNLAATLEPGAVSIWLIGDSAPYGVYVDTPALIGALSEQFGFTVEKDIIMRKRGGRWPQNGTRHDVQLSERTLIFRR
ncbi:hypothetical protein SMD20_27670 [Nonomuraea sp. LP-02]|uniref:hypothetical protein n=1 Tax=Nonomuraea sp. LP-02 TaxID=3097960 RepID=UPI002E30672D|nr:hypothetical protein [Nonomuraea sp. LP-02]MED7928067.1 hypothetical protein [Nonomuraea sp. LP-02]